MQRVPNGFPLHSFRRTNKRIYTATICNKDLHLWSDRRCGLCCNNICLCWIRGEFADLRPAHTWVTGRFSGSCSGLAAGIHPNLSVWHYVKIYHDFFGDLSAAGFQWSQPAAPGGRLGNQTSRIRSVSFSSLCIKALTEGCYWGYWVICLDLWTVVPQLFLLGGVHHYTTAPLYS